jgi:hypothetical protein
MTAYVILRVSIDESAWTPVVAPVDLDAFSIRCDDGTMRIRTTAADASTEDLLAAGAQEVVDAPLRHHRGEVPRFRQGDVVIYARMEIGAGTVILRSVESPNPSPRPRAD